MASQKNRKNAKWTRESTVDLLAHLDLIVGEVKGRCLDEDEDRVIRELKTALNHRFSAAQIAGKLQSMKKDKCEPWTIYQFGTSHLNIPDDMKESLIHRLAHLRVTTPRRPRATSRRVENPMKRDRSVSIAHGTPSKRLKSKPRSDTPKKSLLLQSNRHPDLRLSENSRISTPRSIVRFDTNDGETTCKPEPLESTESIDWPDTLDSTSTTHSDLNGYCESHIVPSSSVEPHPRATITPVSEDIANGVSSHTDCVGRRTYDSLLAEITRLQEENAEMRLENVYLQENVTKLKQRCSDSEKAYQIRENILKTTTAIPEQIAKELNSRSVRIATRRRQLVEELGIQDLLTLGACNGTAPNSTEIVNKYTELRGTFFAITVNFSRNYLQRSHPQQANVDLAALTRALYSEKDGHLIDFESDIPVNALIQCLAGAAVCEWVFKQEFKPSSLLSTPLLEKYRHHIDRIGGDKFLRNLDFASHQSIFTEEHAFFREEFLPRCVSKHADRLLHALAPYIKAGSRDKAVPELKEKLQNIFRIALEIKILAVVGKDTYECIWPTVNSAFDTNLMEPDATGQPFAQNAKLPLVPGLRVYASDRKLVDYHGFAKGDENFLCNPDVISKAVVLV